jgi:hypothetical protein
MTSSNPDLTRFSLIGLPIIIAIRLLSMLLLPFYLWLGYPCPQPLKVVLGFLVADRLNFYVAFPKVFVPPVFHRWMIAAEHDMGLGLVVVVAQGAFGFV